MTRRSITFFACLAFLPVLPAGAQDITTVDGHVYANSSLRRSGDNLMVKVSMDGGVSSVEIGIPVSRIAKVAFPEPPELAKSLEAASKADAGEVLSLTGPFVQGQDGFKDLPGSWWPEMARLRLLALAASGKDSECADLARRIGSLKTPEAESLAKAGTLFGPLATGDIQAVIVGSAGFPKSGGDQGFALSRLALGRALLSKKDYPGALRSFLCVKVFHPSLALLQPPVLQGASDAYLGMGDKKRAAQSLADLAEDWPASPLAGSAKKKAEGLTTP
jgi:hypothetical protein